MIEELTVFSLQDLADLDMLMHELSKNSYCNDTLLKNVLNDPNVHVFVIRENGHIIATGTLCVIHTLEFTVAGVESVVVSSKHRNLGYSSMLMTAIINTAKNLKVHHIQLTSNPKRVAANHLYQNMGFEKYDTNCYKMELI